MNPDAHFGREVWQKRLVEYVISRRKDGKIPLPMAVGSGANTNERFTSAMVAAGGKVDRTQRDAALKGILGMMRFGQYDSPILLEALGFLLVHVDYRDDARAANDEDAKQLAARAFLKASYEARDEDSKEAYRGIAKGHLTSQSESPVTHDRLDLGDLEADFQKELADAKAWSDRLRADEIGWIRDGKNPDEEFAKRYAAEPKALDSQPWYHTPLGWPWPVLALSSVAALVLFVVAGRRGVRRVRRRFVRATRPSAP